MRQYLDLLDFILCKGSPKEDRTGVGTISTFGYQMRFDLQEGFPLLTTKKVHLKSIIYELLWFLRGETNIKWLNENGSVRIWNAWADENGDLGPIYGKQWRSFDSKGLYVDQIAEVIEQIQSNPHSRRHIVTAWNPAEIDIVSLPPCHILFQFYVNDGKLSCQLYQRSADVFLGVPFNIASYALLTTMVAQVTELEPGEFIHTFGDVHIYNNHIDQVKAQLQREPRHLPKMFLNPDIQHIDDFQYADFRLRDYNPHPPIKAEVAV